VTATASIRDPLASLRAAVAGEALIDDPVEGDFYAQDVYSKGPQPLAVFRPGNIAELSAGLAAAAAAALIIVPRGGGMSYTSGYVADTPGALIVDLGRMTRILAVDPVDMTVTVEAGCSWAALHAALAPRGLRTPVWGTLSGGKASIGGGVSQNGAFWGAGAGSIAASVLSLDVVLVNGRVVTTGAGFFRPHGPDVTGLFAGDGGAFSIKAHVTLPLVRTPVAAAFGSFAFDTAAAAFAAISEIARNGLASECFGFDPFLQSQRLRRASLGSDVRTLASVVKAEGSIWQGLRAGTRLIAAGRDFIGETAFSVHLIVEGRSQPRADEDLAAVRAIALANGGREIENSIPKVLRAAPFPPVNSMLGPDGERWVPVHGIVRHSQAAAAMAAVVALFAANRSALDELGVGVGTMFLPVGRNGFLLEPVFFWPDASEEIHRRSVEAAHLARLRRHPANPAARALVDRLRLAIIALFAEHDAVHFQTGRAYPLRDRIDPAAWQLLGAVKTAVDRDGRMNPGVLGL